MSAARPCTRFTSSVMKSMTSTPVTRRVNQEGPDQQDFRMRAFRNVPVLLQKACVGAPTLMGLVARLASPRTTRAGTDSLRDSPLEGSGFELPVPRCALVAYSAALVAPPDSAVSGSSLNGRLTTPIGGGPETARLTRREDRSAQPGCGPENLVIGRPLEGNSSVRLPATCVCRRNWLPRRIKRADCGPHGPGDLGNVGLSRLSKGATAWLILLTS